MVSHVECCQLTTVVKDLNFQVESLNFVGKTVFHCWVISSS